MTSGHLLFLALYMYVHVRICTHLYGNGPLGESLDLISSQLARLPHDAVLHLIQHRQLARVVTEAVCMHACMYMYADARAYDNRTKSGQKLTNIQPQSPCSFQSKCIVSNTFHLLYHNLALRGGNTCTVDPTLLKDTSLISSTPPHPALPAQEGCSTYYWNCVHVMPNSLTSDICQVNIITERQVKFG